MKRWLNEPLLHFLVGGGVLFAADAWLNASTQPVRRQAAGLYCDDHHRACLYVTDLVHADAMTALPLGRVVELEGRHP
jgi:hypothetical protein